MPRARSQLAAGSRNGLDCGRIPPLLPAAEAVPMHDMQLAMYGEDYRKILAVIQRLVREANAKGIYVVDRNGQLIGEAGEMRGIDTTSLASLTAGCIAATGGLAKIVGGEGVPVHFHQGQRDNLHISLISGRI